MGLLDALFGGGDEGFRVANDAIEKNRKLLDEIALPEYQEWVPEQYKSENIDFQTIAEDPVTRSLQMQVLKNMAGLSESGLSAVDEAGFANARDEANQMAKSSSEAALQNAQNRGASGSGLEFAMREMGNQGAAERARKQSLDVAAESARNRALYSKMYGDALSGQRADDFRAQSQNTNIINDFNTRNTMNRNAAAQNNVGLTNDSFKYNQGLKDKNYQNQMGKATGHMQMNQQQADIAMAKDEQRRRQGQAVGGMAGAAIGYGMGGKDGAGIGYGIGSMF